MSVSVDRLSTQCLQHLIPSPEALACLPEASAKRLLSIPLAIQANAHDNNSVLLLAVVSPEDATLRERLARQLPRHMTARCIAADEFAIVEALEKCYETTLHAQPLIEACGYRSDQPPAESVEPSRVIRLIEAILRCAYLERASDIHVSTAVNFVNVRLRVDGVLRDFTQLHSMYSMAIPGRLKVLAMMDIAESRLPQDGQFTQFIEGVNVDFRVSIFPTINGENCVLRVLTSEGTNQSLQSLGLPCAMKEALLGCLHKPNGLIVFCGPTGSGKSTSLHALLSELDRNALNIMTLEDPVETVVTGVCQTSIDPARSFGYTEGLRAMLRQDPDVMLVGEVRDSLSSQMMLRATMTGHQVLTTVHASNAIAAIGRLLDLGICPQMLSANLTCIASQRLIRKPCPDCLQAPSSTCQCRGSGYFGRQVVMELLEVTPTIAALISTGAQHDQIFEAACLNGFESFRVQTDRLVSEGVADVAEVHRVFGYEAMSDYSSSVIENIQ